MIVIPWNCGLEAANSSHVAIEGGKQAEGGVAVADAGKVEIRLRCEEYLSSCCWWKEDGEESVAEEMEKADFRCRCGEYTFSRILGWKLQDLGHETFLPSLARD